MDFMDLSIISELVQMYESKHHEVENREIKAL